MNNLLINALYFFISLFIAYKVIFSNNKVNKELKILMEVL